jgi:hypothetical protein
MRNKLGFIKIKTFTPQKGPLKLIVEFSENAAYKIYDTNRLPISTLINTPKRK